MLSEEESVQGKSPVPLEHNEPETEVETRKRCLTEKGISEKISRLKKTKTSALTSITKKRNEITKLMSDENNLHLIKTELTNLNNLFEEYLEKFNSFCELLDEEQQELEYLNLDSKERSFLEFRKLTVDWIAQTEQRLLDNIDSNSCTTAISRASSKGSKSRLSAAYEKAKLAELRVERSLLRKKQELQLAKEDFELEVQIAKAEAREKVFVEEEGDEFKLTDEKSLPVHSQIGVKTSGTENGISALIDTLHASTSREHASTFREQQPPQHHLPVPRTVISPSHAAVGIDRSKGNISLRSPRPVPDPPIPPSHPEVTENFLPKISSTPSNPEVITPSSARPPGSYFNPTATAFVPRTPLTVHRDHNPETGFGEWFTPDLSAISRQDMVDILKMQHQQNEQMVATHRHLAAAMTLPQPQVPKFKGDPTEYMTFMRAFDARIESRAMNKADCLYYLEQQLEGEPKDLIGGCMYMSHEEGYQEARRLLNKEYGDPYKVAMAHVKKALQWPSIKADDPVGLKHLSFFLRKCRSAMAGITHLSVLNHTPNLQTIILKLPSYIQGKWRDRVFKMKKVGKQVGFAELVDFVDSVAEAANDPVFSREALNSKEETQRPSGIQTKKIQQTFNSKKSSFATSLDTPQSKSSNNQCTLCSKTHMLEDCDQFLKKNVAQRKEFLKESRLCFACFGGNHISKGCTKRKTCEKCNKRHPTALHIDGFQISEKDKMKEFAVKVNNGCIDVPRVSCNKADLEQSTVLHAILPVKVRRKGSDHAVITYAFIDSGSGGCFATERLKDQLGMKGSPTTLQLGTMHGESLVQSTILNDLLVTDLEGKNEIELSRVYTREDIPVDHSQIPTRDVVSRLKYLKEIAEVLPDYRPDLDINLLIGSDCPNALEPLKVVPSNGNGPFAVKYRLGWSVNGPIKVTFKKNTHKVTVNRISVQETSSVKEIISLESIQRMFELDFSDRNIHETAYSQEDKVFLAKVNEEVKQVDGHYEVPLVFKRSNISLPDNRQQAIKRAQWQRKKMLKGENFRYREDYVAFVNDVISKGYAEQVPVEQLAGESGKVWYIPHHGVYHPKKPGKIRVVFDCSARFEGTSINDLLVQGPDLTNSLVGVLSRFRQEPVAFMADIEAMFHQVRIPPEHVDFFRFFWWPDGNLGAELQEYRMVVHLFGAVSSPSSANFALKKTADDCEKEHGELVADTLRRNFYVDDCLRSVESDEVAVDLIRGLRQSCSDGGFHLTKFTCNSRKVIESVPEEERSKEIKSLNLDCDSLPVERALGLHWCVESDSFGFRIVVKDKPHTRRGILSIVSSVYDPLGFVAPFILPAKKLLRDLCSQTGLSWDDEIPQEYHNLWSRWLQELPLLEKLEVNRCVKPKAFGKVVEREIHAFADASSIGYGSVVYLRLLDDKNQIHCAFLIGKARLAPMKAVTIPRLELVAATISVKLVGTLLKELDWKPDDIFYHTDSTTVLRYIDNEQKRFQVFVANRIQVIRDSSSPAQWQYVETKANSADDGSRGLDGVTFLQNQRWLTGPEFLSKPKETWSPQPFTLGPISDDDSDVKKTSAFVATVTKPEPLNARNPTSELIHHYSDWYRLKKAVVVYLRLRKLLIERSKSKGGIQTKFSGSITALELEESELAIIQFIQSQHFKEEITTLKKKGQKDENVKENAFKKNHAVYRLDPFLNERVLCVGGRICRADIPHSMRNPSILPRKSHLTSLIIRSVHRQLGHAGRAHVLATLREKFWIIGANAAVRHELHRCVNCRRYQASTAEQKMAELPKDRLTPAPPFTFVGVDYFGPYHIKEGRKELKRYGALFTCLVSRSVHIEVASSLETDSFINALRRFIARRGLVKEMRSDNGTNFVGAEKELKECLLEMNHEKIREELSQRGISWTFNPPTASNQGGVWERQIRSVRKILAGLLSEHGNRLDLESFSTLLCEVEAIVNSRPLTFISDDPDDLHPLAPCHILTGKSSVILPPPGQFQNNDVYMRRRWRRVQYLANLFWSRWKREYLVTLQQRTKWNKSRRNMEVGDVVVLKEDNAARNQWNMGLIVDTEADSNGFVRSVKVKTQNSVLRRPINKLVLLLPNEQ